MTPRPAPLAARVALLTALASLAACQGSEAQPLEPIFRDPLGGGGGLVEGGGTFSTLGYCGLDANGSGLLRLVRHGADAPDQLAALGDVSFPGLQIRRLAVSDEATAVVAGGQVFVVDGADPFLTPQALPGLDDAEQAVVAGRWVLGARGLDLVLVSRDAPGAALVQAVSAAPTALLAVGDRFLAFTPTGFVAVDPAGVTTFVERTDPEIRDFHAAYAAAGGALAAGPAALPDRSRVVRLDLTDPAAPAAVHGREVSGRYVAFAWDGAATSVLAIHGAGDDADPRSFHQGWLLREEAGAFTATGLPLSAWSRSDQPLAAHLGRLFVIEWDGLHFLRIR